MGVRGELFSAKVALRNRTYFFNVKENRLGDVFMTVVESKPSEGEGFDRHQIVLFADDMQEFLKGFESSLQFIEKEVGTRAKAKREARSRSDPRNPEADRAARPHDGKKILRRKEGAPGAKGRNAFAQRASKGPQGRPKPTGTKRPKVRSVKPEQD